MAATVAAPLVEALRHDDGPALVVTGAGVSAASGIPTFRGRAPGAVWNEHDLSVATQATFWRDPVGQLAWYLERFSTVDAARPNAAHRALADLEGLLAARGRRLLLVTQNIDTLHEQAGHRRLIKVHGTADRLRCGRTGCALGAPLGSIARERMDLDAFRQDPCSATLPRCPRCATPLRPHVLFFDEYYSDHSDYRFAEVESAAEDAALLLFVGTSFSVGATSLLLQAGSRRGVPMFSIDPEPLRLPETVPVRHLPTAAEVLLPVVVSALARG
jgi:NAD-dependent protein deacetylase/lipoamidase